LVWCGLKMMQMLTVAEELRRERGVVRCDGDG